MYQNSTTTFMVIAFIAATAPAWTGSYALPSYGDEHSSLLPNAVNERGNASSVSITYYGRVAKNITRKIRDYGPVKAENDESLQRFEQIKNSFSKHSIGFPVEKKNYILELANRVCQLPFIDNLSEYNEFDRAIDTVLKLSNGQTLSISQFIDEEIEAPVVFSIHRGKELLVTDEMPLWEIVDTINSAMQKS